MKKYLSLTLALVLIALSLVSLASCGDTDAPVAESDTAAAAQTTAAPETEPAETVDMNKVAELPELNYKDEVITVISSGKDWWVDEVSVEQSNGEVINDAVWNRNLRVEQRLGVKINNVIIPFSGYGDIDSKVAKDFSAGDNNYDISFMNSYRAVMDITKGYFFDLIQVEYLNLEKDYWLQSLNNSISFHGRQYVATGDISMSTYRMAFVTMFNKALFDDKKVPYLYEAVESGKWTIEYQLSLISQFYADNDGSQTQTDADTYGLIASAKIMADPYWEAFGLSIMTKDDNGDYKYSIDHERFSNGMDQLIKLFGDNATHKYPHESSDNELQTMSKSFADGRGAMTTTILFECEREWTRNMNDPYGIVPMPKLNEEQQDYGTHLFDQYTVVSVLSTVPEDRRSMMGAFLEAMAYQSSVDTVPAYYEISLKMKYQSDPQSWEMLDRVMDCATVDAGNLYYSVINSPHAQMGAIADTGRNSSLSILKGMQKACGLLIDKLNVNLSAMD